MQFLKKSPVRFISNRYGYFMKFERQYECRKTLRIDNVEFNRKFDLIP